MLPAAVAAGPLDDDNLLSEILLRLPPLPSSLPRASAVCKRWRSLASDPAFSCRCRLHHRRNPPLLGCFHTGAEGISFEPTLEAPNRVPPGRLSLQFNSFVRLLGCRHGLVLILDQTQQLLVWDPVTGHQHNVSIPTGFDRLKLVRGAVLRAAPGDVHFPIVLVTDDHEMEEWPAVACVYSSKTGAWGNLILTPIPSGTLLSIDVLGVLVGHSLYWMLSGNVDGILEFDLEKQGLAVIRLPEEVNCWKLMRAEGGGLGLLRMPDSNCNTQLWKRKTDCDGVASWVLGRTIELDKLLSMNSEEGSQSPRILWFAEDNNAVLVRTFIGVFMVQFELLHFKKVIKSNPWYSHYPFEGVYTAGKNKSSYLMFLDYYC